MLPRFRRCAFDAFRAAIRYYAYATPFASWRHDDIRLFFAIAYAMIHIAFDISLMLAAAAVEGCHAY